MDPFPPVALLCCILTVSIKCVDMENLSGLDPLYVKKKGTEEAVMTIGAVPSWTKQLCRLGSSYCANGH